MGGWGNIEKIGIGKIGIGKIGIGKIVKKIGILLFH